MVRDEPVRVFDNPVASDEVVGATLALARSRVITSASLTGGEPLEQFGFACALARGLAGGGLTVHLETNGIHADQVARIAPWVGVVAMDVKLPSAVGCTHWDAHDVFLEALAGEGFIAPAGEDNGRAAFVKIVVDRSATMEEVDRAARLVSRHDRNIPVILQPESGHLFGSRSSARGVLSRSAAAPHAAALIDFVLRTRRIASRHLNDVRVIPQCHKIFGVR